MAKGEQTRFSDFDEYLRAQEPGRREKAWAWKTAIGLQQVDGLTPSKYLIETAKRNIEGDTSQTLPRRRAVCRKDSRLQSDQIGMGLGSRYRALRERGCCCGDIGV